MKTIEETKEFAIDIDGSKFEVVSRNLQYEREIWQICLNILSKPRKKNEKRNVLSIFRKNHKELYDYILARTPLLSDKKYSFQTRVVWTLNGLLSFPLCKNESCHRPLVGKNVFISNNMQCSQYCNGACVTSAKEVLEKRKQTNLKHFGTEWVTQSQKVKSKAAKTYKKHYGVNHYFQSKAFKDAVIPQWIEKYGVDNPSKNKDIVKKIQAVFMEKYGCISPNQNVNVQMARKMHCIEKYGVDNWMKTEEASKLASKRKEKETETKRKNGTFTTSIPENEIFNLLKETFPNTIRQYRSEKYPFNCDFYIPEKDLYIEFNGTWTHGKHAFDSSNEEDLQIVEKWKAKNKPFYNTAIYVWTDLDSRKREIAKQNGLNFIEFWNIDEVKAWLSNISLKIEKSC